MFAPPYLKIISQKKDKEGDTITYTVHAEGWNRNNCERFSIKFREKIKERDRTPENMKALNERLRRSLLIVKHHGGYVADGTDEKEMDKLLDKLSTTNTGIGVRIRDDLLPELCPFP